MSQAVTCSLRATRSNEWTMLATDLAILASPHPKSATTASLPLQQHRQATNDLEAPKDFVFDEKLTKWRKLPVVTKILIYDEIWQNWWTSGFVANFCTFWRTKMAFLAAKSFGAYEWLKDRQYSYVVMLYRIANTTFTHSLDIFQRLLNGLSLIFW